MAKIIRTVNKKLSGFPYDILIYSSFEIIRLLRLF